MGEVALTALDAPMFTIDRGYLQEGASGVVDVPSPAFLIEHPKGLLLFDTSLDPLAYDAGPAAVYGEALVKRVNMSLRSEQRPDRQITRFGYRIADVTRVVLSHLHFDHAGGLRLFPDATVFIGRGEIEAARIPPPMQSGVYRRTEIDVVTRAKRSEVPGCDVDIFGDGSVVILWTPGHTPGGLSLLVRLPHRNVILTGDTVHCREHLEQRTPYYNDADRDAAVRSLDRIARLRDELEAIVWISHDPEDWSAHPIGTPMR